MKYINANTILPASLVKELQHYIQGSYLYIPIDTQNQKQWGEVSGYRKELEERNRQIRAAHRQGIAISELATRYALSSSAIYKILHNH